MNCPRCGSDRTYQFEATESLKMSPENLPAVCRSCGCITVAGKEVTLPEQLEQHAKEVANQAAGVIDGIAQAAARDLETEPDRVEHYFRRVATTAYLDGFWRALAYFRHHAKEGRLSRLRDLWTKASTLETTFEPDAGRIRRVRTLALGPDEYAEFEYLLFLGAKEPPHAKDLQNQRPAAR